MEHTHTHTHTHTHRVSHIVTHDTIQPIVQSIFLQIEEFVNISCSNKIIQSLFQDLIDFRPKRLSDDIARVVLKS